MSEPACDSKLRKTAGETDQRNGTEERRGFFLKKVITQFQSATAQT